MRTLLFLLLTVSVSAQITTMPQIIYKAKKAETVTASFSCSECVLSVKVGGENILDKAVISGYNVQTISIDSGETIVAFGKGVIGHTIYKNGVNVTPALSADNSEAEIIAFVDGLTTAKLKRLIAGILISKEIPIKKLKKYL